MRRPLPIHRLLIIAAAFARGLVLCVGAELAAAEPEPASLSQSAQVATTARTPDRFQQADVALAQEKFSEAFTLLQSVLGDPDAGFVEQDGVWLHASQAVARRFENLPRPALLKYEQQFGPEARRQLARASGSRLELLRVARVYCHTRAGYAAIRTLSAQAFDHGEFESAVRGLRSLLVHPFADPADRPALLARLVLAQAFAGDAAGAKATLERHRELLEQHVVPGTQREMSGWLNALLERQSTQAASEDGRVPPVERRGPPLPVDAGPPALVPAWERRSAAHRAVEPLLHESLQKLQTEGATPLPGAVPLLADGRLLVRLPDGIAGYEVASGKLLWNHQGPAAPDFSARDEEQKLLLNTAFQSLMQERLAREFQVGTIHQRMATDGSRVYYIEQSARAGSALSESRGAGSRGAKAQDVDDPGGEGLEFSKVLSPPASLIARDAQMGDELWRLPSVQSSHEFREDRSGGTRDVHFLGPPCVQGGTLFALVQCETLVELWALESRDGTRIWSCPLADVGHPWSADLRRRETALSPRLAEGLLLCPTGAGALVAVDLLTRLPRWAYRYPRDYRPVRIERRFGAATAAEEETWWEGWRDTYLASTSGRVFLASRESELLHALDLASGKAIWTRPARGALHVAGIVGESQSGDVNGERTGDRLVVVEALGVLLVAAESGKAEWQREVGIVGGRGMLTATHFHIPLQRGGIASFDLDSGEPRFTSAARTIAPASLVYTPQGVAFQTGTRVGLLPNLPTELKARRGELDQQIDRATVESLIELVLFERDAGNFASAVSLARQVVELREDGPRRAVLFEMLLAALRDAPANWSELATELLALSENDRLAEVLHAAARAAAGNNEILVAFEHYLHLLELRLDAASAPTLEMVEPSGAPARRVSTERLIQGELADLFERSDPVLRTAMTQRLREWMQRQQQRFPAAVQRLSAQILWLPAPMRLSIRADLGRNSGDDLLEQHLGLLAQSQHRDRVAAATACFHLARLLDGQHYHELGHAHWQRLLGDFAEVKVVDGQTAAEWLEGQPSGGELVDVRGRRMGSGDPWPAGMPEVRETGGRTRVSVSHNVPVTVRAGSLAARLSIAVTAKGDRVEFRGAGQNGMWALALPESGSAFRVAYNLSQAWGIGPLVILQVGSELFGIAPLNSNGEPQARVLWQLDTRRDPDWSNIKTIPARTGFGVDRLQINDRSGRGIAKVGPVRAGYLCYEEQDAVVVVDTRTGEPLWLLQGRLPGDVLLGDEETLIRLRPGRNLVECRRVLDGRVLDRFALPFEIEQLLLTDGCRALVETAGADQMQLRMVDLTCGRTDWELRRPAGTQPFQVGDGRFGTLEPDGTLALWSLENGRPVARHPTLRRGHAEQIHVISDPHRIIVAVSGPLALPALKRADRVREGYRNPVIRGEVFCLDRHSGDLLWSQQADHVAFPLDQAPESPLLLAFVRQSPEAGGAAHEERVSLQFLSRATGQLVHELGSIPDGAPVALDADLARGQVDAHVGQHSVRFVYAP